MTDEDKCEIDDHHGSSSTDGVTKLKQHITIFEETSQIPLELDFSVYSSEQTQILWFTGLLKEWKTEPEPNNPKEATRRVYQILRKVHRDHGLDIDLADIEGLLYFYGLPHHYSVLSPSERGFSDREFPDYGAPYDVPAFKFWTLPVNKDEVTDAGGFTVYVEVNDFHLLSPEMLYSVSERCKALADGNGALALKLRNQIDDTPGYKVVDIDNVEVLTKKFEIRLRGIRAPEIGTPNGIKARDRLANMVSRKSLKISVYYLDELKRCVGDVYSVNDKLLQEQLLKKWGTSLGWEKDRLCMNKGRDMAWVWRRDCWQKERGWRIDEFLGKV